MGIKQWVSIQLHFPDFSSSDRFERYETIHLTARKDKIGANRMTAIAFLKRYLEVNGQLCPTVRGTTIDREVAFLPSNTTKIEVHKNFKEDWSDLIAFVQGRESIVTLSSSNPVQYPKYVAIWKSECGFLKISRPSSELCDTCTVLKNALKSDANDTARLQIQSSLENHVRDVKTEAKFLTLHRTDAKQNSSEFPQIIVDFSENVLLASMELQPRKIAS